uniref:CA216 n=1 Tax=Xiphophorus maculatus TaxID=8083 RepID=A0A3B5R6W9_XIPMA
MLHHQNQHLDLAYRGGTNSCPLRNKDSNFNFLPGANDEAQAETRRGGDENRNQVRPRNLPLGRDPQSSPTSGFNSSLMSPRSRLPCWSPLEPLPEIETGDDGYGRVPPDGAEEWRTEEEEERMMMFDEKKERQRKEEDPDDEWGDSDSESEFSCRSGGSVSSLNEESGGEAGILGGWDRVGVGEPKSSKPEAGPTRTGDVRQRSFSNKPPTGSDLPGERNHGDNQSSDSDGELPELMDAVWTLRDRERFKAQEMEKHQVQLTMYRRLALIRWVRTLQGRVQEQQNRLQSSFDVILTHRKELLRMGFIYCKHGVLPFYLVFICKQKLRRRNVS